MEHRTTTRTTHRRGRRAATTGLAALLLAGAAPALPASATTPLRETQHEVHVPECTTAAAGDLRAQIAVGWSDHRGSDPSVQLVDESGALVAYDTHEDGSAVSWDGSVLSGQVTLVAAGTDDGGGQGVTGDQTPAAVFGTARFSLLLVEDGDPNDETLPYREGNVRGRTSVHRQPMRVAQGTVTVTTATVEHHLDATGCTGSATTAVLFVTQPDTTVTRPQGAFDAVCETTNADGQGLWLDLDAHGDAAEVYLSVVEDESTATFGVGVTAWAGVGDPLRAEAEMVRRSGEDHADAGTAVVDLTTRRTGQTRYSMVFEGGRDTVATTFFALEGAVTVPGFAPFRLSGCEGLAQTALNRRSSPSDPTGKGPAPAHDDLATAAVLEVGAPRTNLQTGAAARDAELPMSCLDDPAGDGVLVPGHTVWFRITGTGAPVTVSPAGSSFNTVLAAYASDGAAGLVEVGCADDVVGDPHAATTQAPLSVDTVQGATYWVQVGGFAHQSGRLRVAATA